ncbi:MAG TPA: transglycosylase SLT domain-containing protein, partial [Azospirillum sp.]
EARRLGLAPGRDDGAIEAVTQAKLAAALADRRAAFAQMAAEQRRQVAEVNHELSLLGLGNAERAKAVEIHRTLVDLLDQGADLTDAGTQAYVRQQGEIARIRAVIEENTELARDLAHTIAGGLERIILDPAAKARDVLRALVDDMKAIVTRVTITKPFETWFTGLMAGALNPGIAVAADNVPKPAGDGAEYGRVLRAVNEALRSGVPIPVVVTNLGYGLPATATAAPGGAAAAVEFGRGFASAIQQGGQPLDVAVKDSAGLRTLITGLAEKVALDPRVLWGIAGTESSWAHTNADGSVKLGPAVTRLDGTIERAIGLFQVMPSTAAAINRKTGTALDPYDQTDNATLGVLTLLDTLERTGGDLNRALAAYGGFVTKDPAGYLATVERFGATLGDTGAALHGTAIAGQRASDDLATLGGAAGDAYTGFLATNGALVQLDGTVAGLGNTMQAATEQHRRSTELYRADMAVAGQAARSAATFVVGSTQQALGGLFTIMAGLSGDTSPLAGLPGALMAAGGPGGVVQALGQLGRSVGLGELLSGTPLGSLFSSMGNTGLTGVLNTPLWTSSEVFANGAFGPPAAGQVFTVGNALGVAGNVFGAVNAFRNGHVFTGIGNAVGAGAGLAPLAGFTAPWLGPLAVAAPIVGMLADSLFGGLFEDEDYPTSWYLGGPAGKGGQGDALDGGDPVAIRQLGDRGNALIAQLATAIGLELHKIPAGGIYNNPNDHPNLFFPGGFGSFVGPGDQHMRSAPDLESAVWNYVIDSLRYADLADLKPDVRHALTHTVAGTAEELLSDLTFADTFAGQVAAMEQAINGLAEAFQRGASAGDSFTQRITGLLDSTARVFGTNAAAAIPRFGETAATPASPATPTEDPMFDAVVRRLEDAAPQATVVEEEAQAARYRAELTARGVTPEVYDALKALGEVAARGERIDPRGPGGMPPDFGALLDSLAAIEEAMTAAGAAIPAAFTSLDHQLKALKAARAAVDAEISGATGDMTAVARKIEEVRGYWTSMEAALTAVGYSGDTLAAKLDEGLGNAMARLRDDYAETLQDQLDQARGYGFMAQIRTVVEARDTALKDIAALHGTTREAGIRAAQAAELFERNLWTLLSQLDADQLEEAARRLALIAPGLAGIVGEARRVAALTRQVQEDQAAAERHGTIRTTYVGLRETLAPGRSVTGAGQLLLDAGLHPFDFPNMVREIQPFFEHAKAFAAGADAMVAVVDRITQAYRNGRFSAEQYREMIDGLDALWQRSVEHWDSVREAFLGLREMIFPGREALSARDVVLGAGASPDSLAGLLGPLDAFLGKARAHTATARELFDAYVEVTDAHHDGLLAAESYREILGALGEAFQDTARHMEVLGQAVRTIDAFLAQMEVDDLSVNDPLHKLAAAQEQFLAAVAAAQHDPARTAEALQAAQAYRQIARSIFASAPGYGQVDTEIRDLLGGLRDDGREAVDVYTEQVQLTQNLLGAANDNNDLSEAGNRLLSDINRVIGDARDRQSALVGSTNTLLDRINAAIGTARDQQVGVLTRLLAFQQELKDAFRAGTAPRDYGANPDLNRLLAMALPQYTGGFSGTQFTSWAVANAPAVNAVNPSFPWLNQVLALLGANPNGFGGLGTWGDPFRQMAESDIRRIAARELVRSLGYVPGFALGGRVPLAAMAAGGLVGNGLWNVDSVVARHADGGGIALAGGEYVVRAPAVNAGTLPALEHINLHGRTANDTRGGDLREVAELLRALLAELRGNTRVTAAGGDSLTECLERIERRLAQIEAASALDAAA